MQTHRSAHCTSPKNNQKMVDGSNKKTKQTYVIEFYTECGISQFSAPLLISKRLTIPLTEHFYGNDFQVSEFLGKCFQL